MAAFHIARRRSPRDAWSPAPEGLHLLEREGSPFSQQAFRTAWLEAYPEWTDSSFAAITTDGTVAAVAAMTSGDEAVSMPFNPGGVVATKGLDARQMSGFLDSFRAHHGVGSITVNSVAVRPSPGTAHRGGMVRGWTYALAIHPSDRIVDRLSSDGRRGLRRAERVAEACVTSDATGFLKLYGEAAQRQEHWLKYRDELIVELLERRVARCYEVRWGDDVVAAWLLVAGPRYWAFWLGAQDERGRSISANHLAVTEAILDAQRQGVRSIDLGTSHGMPSGVDMFKRRFDTVRTPQLSFASEGLRHRTRRKTAVAGRKTRSRLRRLL